jgi:competence protein ComEC
VLVDTKGIVVIDAGPGSGLLEFLDEQRIDRVNVVLLSHADKDHISGLLALLAAKTIRVDRIYVNTDSLKTSRLWDDLLYELELAKKAGKVKFEVSLVEDRSGRYDQGAVRVEILAPSTYLAGKGPGSKDRRRRRLASNSVSAVVRLVQDGKPIALFPGDIDEVGLTNMIEGGGDAKSPILVFPHHGGRACRDMAGFVRALLDLTGATTVLFSVTRGEPAHPDPAVIAAVRKYSSNLRVACTQLSEHCARNIPVTKAQHLNPVFARGRENNTCCAGSFVIELDRPDSLLPGTPAHGTFIATNAPSALCK